MSDTSGLGSIDKIVLSTRLGECIVELMCGDITLLPIQDKVDVVLISAFPNDYSLTNSNTLIDALHNRYGLSVESLSRNKDVDLRRNFSCWVSKPLSENLPFSRLVCFERIFQSGTVSEQIARIYRAFTPIFNNEDTTVISPLLATGNQGKSTAVVLQAMVNGACGWILSGLPLRHMKIVIYSKSVHEIYQRDEKTVYKFQELKQRWEKISQERIGKVGGVSAYDVYLSYSSNDEHSTQKVISRLKQIQPTIKLFTKIMSFQNDEVWQEKIFDVMVKSKRIIVILSPGYIADEHCLEQFNMAMCCNRLKKKQVLAPIYIETIPSLPSYMLYVQYVECRIRKESDNAEELITSACKIVIKAIEDDTATEIPTVTETSKYDVFISYAHRTSEEAETLLSLLQTKAPSLNIFFDKSELSTGSVWQKSLYEAIDNAAIIVALISDSYVRSTVCREEYNIALARHLSKDDICFIPVCCKDMDLIPSEFSDIPMLDVRKDKDRTLDKLADDIIKYKTDGFHSELYVEPSSTQDIKMMLEKQRKSQFYKLHKVKMNKMNLQVTPKISTNEKTDIKIVFSFSQNSLKYAAAICQFLENTAPSIQCVLLSENSNERLTLLDTADRIVILISKQYIQSNLLMEEFHIALCRQRVSPKNNILYLVQTSFLDIKPIFITLVPYSLSLKDSIWQTLLVNEKIKFNDSVQIVIKRSGIAGSYSFTHLEFTALTAAAVDLRYGFPEWVEWLNILNIMMLDKASIQLQLHKCLKPRKEAENSLKTQPGNVAEISEEKRVGYIDNETGEKQTEKTQNDVDTETTKKVKEKRSDKTNLNSHTSPNRKKQSKACVLL